MKRIRCKNVIEASATGAVRYLLLSSIMLLASCAITPSNDSASIKQHVHFYGARNDLSVGQRQVPDVYIPQVISGNGVRVINFPLTYAVQCNPAKSECKHAVVKTSLEFTARTADQKSTQFSGVLRSQMGRSLKLTTPPLPGHHFEHQLAIPEGVMVIGEYKDDQKFERVLRPSEKFALDGLAGVRIVTEFE